MAASLKTFFSPALVRRLSAALVLADPMFPARRFVKDACSGLDALELLDRGRHIARAHAAHLPESYPEALAVLLRSLGPEHAGDELIGGVYSLVDKRWPMSRPAERRSPPWTRTQSRLIVIVVLAAVGAGVALPFLLLRNSPSRSRHEYLLEGQILSIALDRTEVNITHGAINGFRPATTTSYNVPDAGELADVKPGELITATLVVVRGDIHLEDVKKVIAAR